MSEFVEIPASKMSIAKRTLIQSIGINDAIYLTNPKLNGKQGVCPYYNVWYKMLTRCYSEVYLATHPTYKGCMVCTEWLTFSNFKAWMKLQDWKNKELDKDINGNSKLYSPENCCFVSSKINTLLITGKAKRGKHKLGVHWCVRYKKYVAYCNVQDKRKNLGYFTTEQEAHEAYCTYKANLIKKIAEEQTDLRIKNALIERANTIHLVE